MGLFQLIFADKEKQRLRKLLRDYADRDIRIVGAGTVSLDPEKIIESDEYEQFTREMERYTLN